MSVGALTLGLPISVAFLVEPYIPLGHWLWGVIALGFVLPSAITYGVPYIKRCLGPKPFTVIHSGQDEAAGDSLDEIDNDLVRFRECLPQVERCQTLIGQYAGPLGGFYMWIMSLRYSFAEDITRTTLIRALEYLTRNLDPLGIRCPAVHGAKDELPGDFLVRLRTWNMHLTELTEMIRYDDLTGARRLMQPTSDKSDALC